MVDTYAGNVKQLTPANMSIEWLTASQLNVNMSMNTVSVPKFYIFPKNKSKETWMNT